MTHTQTAGKTIGHTNKHTFQPKPPIDTTHANPLLLILSLSFQKDNTPRLTPLTIHLAAVVMVTVWKASCLVGQLDPERGSGPSELETADS